jgi:aromatic ring-opening dioxygenase catalytic subunit (LigB family)
MTTPNRLPTLFLPHGGGPCFFLDPGEVFPVGMWDDMAAYLKGIASTLAQRPKALLVISGHWEEPIPTTYGPPTTSLLFDYYGFPKKTYQLKYPAPGDPKLAAKIKTLLNNDGIASTENQTRGFDHGVFIPLMLAFPDASIPIVQLSLQAGLDPSIHLALGRALEPLRNEDDGVLIIASGMSYHNMRGFSSPAGNEASEQFDAWLNDAVTDPDPTSRARKLKSWSKAPGALEAHPHPEHLLPLMVAVGSAGEDAGWRNYHGHVSGKAISGFQFGGAKA